MFPAILSKTWWRSLVKGENSEESAAESEELDELSLSDDELDEEPEEVEEEEVEREEPKVWRGKVDSARSFFSTELIYRYDILDPALQNKLKGRYRVEVKGNNGGTWTLIIDNKLEVLGQREEADIVLSVQQKDFLSLVNGDLNPQMALLAQKVRLQGDVRQASLFQCLLAPPGQD